MAKSSADRFRAPAQKYVGKMEIMGGPIPIGQMHRPLLKNQHETQQQQGTDLRPERPVKKPKTPAEVKKHDNNRQKGGG